MDSACSRSRSYSAAGKRLQAGSTARLTHRPPVAMRPFALIALMLSCSGGALVSVII